MKPIIKLAAVAAVLLSVSAGAQAHQYHDLIVGYVARLDAVETSLRGIECHGGTTSTEAELTTCQPANAAALASAILKAIPANATDAQAKHAFQMADMALEMGQNEQIIPPMYAELKGDDAKIQALSAGLTESIHISGALLGASIGEEDAR